MLQRVPEKKNQVFYEYILIMSMYGSFAICCTHDRSCIVKIKLQERSTNIQFAALYEIQHRSKVPNQLKLTMTYIII